MKNKGLPCSAPECTAGAVKKLLCEAHYQQLRTRGAVRPRERFSDRGCSYPGCERPHRRRGWCEAHNSQAVKVDDDVTRMRPIKVERLPRIYVGGYAKVWAPEHPNAQAKGWILEHTKVMSETLGRPLVPGENVHHINGVKTDNRPENLELWNTHQPKGQRVDDKVEWAMEILRLYRPEILR